ncbi:50S ribosomal protein L6 [candidate division TA06 bacterium]|uniref:Large ribosomal subunit protein uL6 n=1 Tax=candidate division TA06 bacterium TaxID=2250710 RepID=A0A933IB10_UNCT6|nr:50S ribosomal protein L6 [candidate division TA06 bacterium]
MSRIGRKPIEIPKGVKTELVGQKIKVTGPKGALELEIHPNIKLDIKDGVLTVIRASDEKFDRSLHGLTRALVFNAVTGVSQGFTRVLQIYGIGFKAIKDPKGLTLNLGFSHPINMEAPQGIEFDLTDEPAQKVLDKTYQSSIVIKGIDKQLVGEVAATIRRFRKPEPYQGKGIRYQGEHIRRKAGKTAAGATGA